MTARALRAVLLTAGFSALAFATLAMSRCPRPAEVWQGQVEATEVDVAAKIAARVATLPAADTTSTHPATAAGDGATSHRRRARLRRRTTRRAVMRRRPHRVIPRRPGRLSRSKAPTRASNPVPSRAGYILRQRNSRQRAMSQQLK